MRTRKKDTKEFKMDAVSLVVEEDYSRSEASKRNDLQHEEILKYVKEIAVESRMTYGRRRIKAVLERLGYEQSDESAISLRCPDDGHLAPSTRCRFNSSFRSRFPVCEQSLQKAPKSQWV